MVSLAYQVQNEYPELLKSVQDYIHYILDHQASDGWMNPVPKIGDVWASFPMLITLFQYAEANPSETTRIVTAMYKFLHALYNNMKVIHLLDWGKARYMELILSLQWLYDNHPQGEEDFLLTFSQLAKQQGDDWATFFHSKFPTTQVKPLETSLLTHGVNNGQAIKGEAVWYRQSKEQSAIDSTYERIEKLDTYHGQASGIFSCDEHLAGKIPSQGSELCTVAETMFSFETIFSILGDVAHAERAEQLGYNAMPATWTSDMWAHQYVQQSNQVWAKHSDPHIWLTDGPDSTLFGLEPNYGCCTVNTQGFPKFVNHLVYRTPDNGLSVAMWGPVQVNTLLPTGVRAVLNISTSYPFDETISIDLSLSSVATSFPLYLRIPSWTKDASVIVNGGSKQSPASGTVFALTLTQASTHIEIVFPMHTKVVRRYNNAASIYHGPLLYSYSLKCNYTVLKKYSYDSKDYQVDSATPWAQALKLSDDSQPDLDLHFSRAPLTPGKTPFSAEDCPVKFTAHSRAINWPVVTNAASAPPQSPVSTTSPLFEAVLLPFGAAKLRVGEIPTCAN
eukprot:TRINITY_DN3928_c0_g1_i1.p1 TRINITY_DN3928_c0_g1~~TRINITY_DN3928_c0_g1_i1.p1  ORF type:complete len:562 (+),score=95.96 TRINITY_DN3928_c0_g1_i1:528-2213(+)